MSGINLEPYFHPMNGPLQKANLDQVKVISKPVKIHLAGHHVYNKTKSVPDPLLGPTIFPNITSVRRESAPHVPLPTYNQNIPKQHLCLIQADSTFRQKQTRFNISSSFVTLFGFTGG